MEREQRRNYNRKNQVSLKNKYIIYWLSILGIVVIALMVFAFNLNKDNADKKIKQGDISNLITSDLDDESKSASSSIGNTLDETKSNIGNTQTEAKNENDAQNTAKDTQTTAQNNNTTNNENKQTGTTDGKTTVNEETSKTENTQVAPEVVKKEVTFSQPIHGTVIKEFAKDNLVYSETLKEWITHNGIDIAADKTTIVKSACSGTVKSIKNDPRYGLTVIMTHDDGFETVYSNLLTAEFIVEGETLEVGQSVGTVGNSSSFESSDEYHLHFEMIKDGEYVDPSIYINY